MIVVVVGLVEMCAEDHKLLRRRDFRYDRRCYRSCGSIPVIPGYPERSGSNRNSSVSLEDKSHFVNTVFKQSIRLQQLSDLFNAVYDSGMISTSESMTNFHQLSS